MGPTTWHASKTARQHRGSSELRAKRFMSNTDGSAVSRIRCCCEWSVNCISYTWWWWVDIHEYSHCRCRRSIKQLTFEYKEHKTCDNEDWQDINHVHRQMMRTAFGSRVTRRPTLVWWVRHVSNMMQLMRAWASNNPCFPDSTKFDRTSIRHHSRCIRCASITERQTVSPVGIAYW